MTCFIGALKESQAVSAAIATQFPRSSGSTAVERLVVLCIPICIFVGTRVRIPVEKVQVVKFLLEVTVVLLLQLLDESTCLKLFTGSLEGLIFLILSKLMGGL